MSLIERIRQAQVEAGERVVVEHLKEQGLMHDDYKQLEIPAGTLVDDCPVCAAKPSLWQYSDSPTSPTSKLVMCSNGDEPTIPGIGIVHEGCLLYMPPNCFYRETQRDAIEFWNSYARALRALRKSNEQAPDNDYAI